MCEQVIHREPLEAVNEPLTEAGQLRVTRQTVGRMVITGIKRTRIIHGLPLEREPSVTRELARRVKANSSAGMSIYQIAAKLGIPRSVVARILPERV